ncbi:MAG: sigma-54 dependent transcriptional regulator [Bdellovibrionales bacterium]|nr:sigma-54 dependent transcriptional regulator [Bdellovibrionales bacterium]
MSKNALGVLYTADPIMKNLLEVAENVASSKATVLIQGESGTGKELLARYIHARSPRCQRKFIAINCAALPEGLLESELFGYEKGAFTGAEQKKLGKFELAQDSTFLLDEISEMPLLLQAKILRVLQEGELERLGGQIVTKINVRILATTNRDLRQMVHQGLFREDLYYRLNVVPMYVPPLRERLKDIELLAKLFLEISCVENQLPIKDLNAAALEKLQSWSWPGNIRELQNAVERSVLLCPHKTLSPQDILIDNFKESKKEAITVGMSLEDVEKWLILKTLELTSQNRSKAAQLLGISVRTLRNKMSLYMREV